MEQAENQLSKAAQQQADNSVAGLSQRAQEMARQQREIANSLKNMYGEQAGSQNRRLRFGQPEPGPNDLPELRDPSRPTYYGYDRRWDRPDPAMPHNPSEQERAIAEQKARLSKEVQDLQHDMQQQERALAGTQPGASAKMRKALSEAEQNELAMRSQKTAEWMKQGYGDRNLNAETKMAEGFEQLSKDLQDVQKAVEAGDPNGNGKGGQKGEQALAEVRNLRRMLEQAQGKQGQGQQQGGQQQGSQTSGPNGGRTYGGYDQENLQGAIDDLSSWRGKIDPHDRALRNSVDDAIGSLRMLHADPNVLQSTIGHDAVSRLERLEVELARRTGELQQLQGARLRAPEDSPEKYRDAVAEYFRKLSQAKQ